MVSSGPVEKICALLDIHYFTEETATVHGSIHKRAVLASKPFSPAKELIHLSPAVPFRWADLGTRSVTPTERPADPHHPENASFHGPEHFVDDVHWEQARV